MLFFFNIVILNLPINSFNPKGKPVGSPDASTFFRMIDEHQIKGMLTAPTTLRVIQNEVKKLHSLIDVLF